MPRDDTPQTQALFEQSDLPFSEESHYEPEEDAAEAASRLAFLKYGKPRKAPLVKGPEVGLSAHPLRKRSSTQPSTSRRSPSSNWLLRSESAHSSRCRLLNTLFTTRLPICPSPSPSIPPPLLMPPPSLALLKLPPYSFSKSIISQLFLEASLYWPPSAKLRGFSSVETNFSSNSNKPVFQNFQINMLKLNNSINDSASSFARNGGNRS